jgi:two-component system, NtrC family, sensor histidine kinase KinB
VDQPDAPESDYFACSTGASGLSSLATQVQCSLIAAAFSCFPFGVAFADPDLVIRAANDLYARQGDRSLDEILNQPAALAFPEWLEQVAPVLETVKKTGQPFRAEAHPIPLGDQPDHHLTYWESTVAPVFSSDGDFCGYLFTRRDVTGTRTAAEELRQSEASYRAIFDAANDAIFIHEVETGRILDVNRRAVEMFGFSPAELRSLSVGGISSGEPPYTQEDALYWLHKAARGRPQLFDWRCKDRHGRLFWVEVNIKRATIGGSDRLLAVVRDVSERKRAEEELRTSRERFREIYEKSPIGIELYDPQGRLVHVNPATLQIFGVADLADIKGFDLFADPNVSDEVKARLRRGEIVRYEAPFDFEKVRELNLYPTSRRGLAYLAVVLIPLGLDDESVTGYLVQVRDVTQRTIAQQFREESASLITHDLRTPLTIIRGQAQLLQRHLQRGSPVERLWPITEGIIKETATMGAMLQDLADSARLEAGKMRLKKLPVGLASWIRDLLERVKGAFDVGRVELRLPPDLPPVSADPNSLDRIFTNLLSNAFKYSPEGGPVIVAAERVANEARISVADRGLGIPAEDLPHIFERYYRGKGARKSEGLGLGLYITRLLVEANGGRIWVQSEPGQGSTFCFTMPLANPK